MSLQKRILVDHQKTVVDGITNYEYTYEITKPNGEKSKKVVRRKTSSSKVPRFVDEEHHETVFNSINEYLQEKQIDNEKLNLMTKSQVNFKPIQSYIIEREFIRVNLPILREFIIREFLKTTNQ